MSERNERDTWLFGGPSKRGRAAVAKAAKAEIAKSGALEPASPAAFRSLVEDARDRQTQARARIVDWGGRDPDQVVDVVRVAKGSDPDPEVQSRQLRDPFTTFYVQGIALEPPLPPDRLLGLTEENVFHSACLAAVSTDACGRGWQFSPKEEKESDDGLVHSDVPEKLKLKMEDLTPDLTFTELLTQAAWEFRAIGWSAWEVVRKPSAPGSFGDVAAIYPIPAHTLRASLDPRKWVQIRAGRVRYFKKFGSECTINNETGDIFEWRGKDKARAKVVPNDYVASELIIFKRYTPRSLWYGLPEWVSCVATIAELGAIREFNVAWFASGGQLDHHIHFKSGSIEVAKEMAAQVKQQIRDNAGRGHTTIVTAGDSETDVQVNKLAEQLREGHFRFRRTDLVKEVLIAHGVPPYRIGWAETGSLGGNAADEMLGAYSVGVVKPIQQVIEDRLRMTLFDPKIGINTGEFRFKLQDMELEDVKGELELAKAGTDGGFMTPNQAREHVGLDPDDENEALDKYYYHGQELGKDPSAGTGQPFGGYDPWADESGDGSEESGQSGQPPMTEKAKSVQRAAHAAVIEVLRGYERKMKEAFADEQEQDALRTPPRKQRQRGFQKPVTAAPAPVETKPNIGA